MKKTIRRIYRLISSVIPSMRQRNRRHHLLSDSMVERIHEIFDAEWYMAQYPHVVQANHTPFKHFIRHGLEEGLSPNAFFLPSWYLARHKDIADADTLPLIHYIKHGAGEGRDPHPDFDVNWYVCQHPEAADSPLLFHIRVGRPRGWSTRAPSNLEDYLPSQGPLLQIPDGMRVDIVLPVYKGLAETQRCLASLLADRKRPDGQIIVIDDCSPEPALSKWLEELAADGAIHLLRNTVNLGFVRSVNRGMEAAGRNDVVLLNSDTEVPEGWLGRLAGHAYSAGKIGSVTPFSNNATICSYPAPLGGELPQGYNLKQLDAAFAHANAGRSISIPTAVGFCMYIRRACLDDIGMFDAETFGLGYGEENDFCMRAIDKGWEHRLACDTYVFHIGEVSFGRKSSLRAKAQDLLQALHPSYPRLVSRHMRADPALPNRFAATATLLRESRLPLILFVTHALGGGTERHVQEVIRSLKGKVECLILRPNEWGYDLFFPGISGHPPLHIAADRTEHLAQYLLSCGLQRVHIHNHVGYSNTLRALIEYLGLPFDLTVHDYFSICPQINLISPVTGAYCGEPDTPFCNTCIARSPIHGSTDILTWRLQHRWVFDKAERVLCPSRDVLQRLQRVGIHGNMIVVPHQPVTNTAWPHHSNPLQPGQALRIAILGTLAGHKGAPAVRNTVISASGQPFEFLLIGSSQPQLDLPETVSYSETGDYREQDLDALIAQHQPHVIWFPALWPETYSYTLSTAINSGLPIVASNLGAFIERLAHNPHAILVSPSENAVPWIAAFEQIRDSLLENTLGDTSATRPLVADYYPDAYLEPLIARPVAPLPAPAIMRKKRRGDQPSVLLVPEIMDNGAYSPGAYIRTILPLDRLAERDLINLTITTPQAALRYQADILVCQNYISGKSEETDKLFWHAKTHGMNIVYDLDDAFLSLPQNHPEYNHHDAKAARIRGVLKMADRVVVSTPELKTSLQALHKNITVIQSGIDERLLPGADTLWQPQSKKSHKTVRILYIGDMKNEENLDIITPAVTQLRKKFGAQFQIDIIGVADQPHLPPGMRRLRVPKPASQTYPAFMNWLASQKKWDIGISPLADTPLNRSRSPTKALDYMAIGAVAVVSDVPTYQDLPMSAVLRVPNQADAWVDALEKLMEDREQRRTRSQAGFSLLLREYTLGVRMQPWLDVLRDDKKP